MTYPSNPNSQDNRESVFDDDPFGLIKEEKKSQTPDARTVRQLHIRDDVDHSKLAHHHTLGIEANQASPGSHNHNGVESKRIGAGEGLILTGAKGGNVALANLITMLAEVLDFTDSTT